MKYNKSVLLFIVYYLYLTRHCILKKKMLLFYIDLFFLFFCFNLFFFLLFIESSPFNFFFLSTTKFPVKPLFFINSIFFALKESLNLTFLFKNYPYYFKSQYNPFFQLLSKTQCNYFVIYLIYE